MEKKEIWQEREPQSTKIVVIGLGSMGKRRIRLLQQYIRQNHSSCNNWEITGIDTDKTRRKEAEKLYGINTNDSLEEVLETNQFEYAIISTAPASHPELIKKCLTYGLHIFTELNLSTRGYDENILLSRKKEKVLFLSSTFMYRKEMEYIKNVVKEVNFRGVYRYHVGQYLPDWHPWESYKSYFIGNKETNGCREIMAIELPWLIDSFGKVRNYHSTHTKISSLEIEYDDCYQIILEHDSGIRGSLIVDVVTPKVERKLEMWQEKFYLEWGGTPDSLLKYDVDKKKLTKIAVYNEFEHKKEYNHSIVEDAYYEEIVNFIDVIRKKSVPKYTFEQDKEILSLIDGIEA